MGITWDKAKDNVGTLEDVRKLIEIGRKWRAPHKLNHK